jgi:hypothetical protein
MPDLLQARDSVTDEEMGRLIRLCRMRRRPTEGLPHT